MLRKVLEINCFIHFLVPKFIRKLAILLFGLFISMNLISDFKTNLVYAAKPVVIVIDPGHGGKNLGTNYLPIPEKYYNMQVALHMKEHLESFNNIKVYLTHEEDVDMSLEERAEFAKAVEADFLVSLHFNMSLSHKLYGSEVWIPSTGNLYSQSYSLANEFILQFKDMGLFSRGIKTRIGKNDADYYGIIRHCTNRNIPAIIVEHCHVDNKNDIKYMNDESMKEFGIRNAEAIAKFYGLTSGVKSTNYGNYNPIAIPTPSVKIKNDVSAPDITSAYMIGYSKNKKYATVQLTAADYDSNIQYYSYSYNDGLTWSEFYPWQEGKSVMTIMVKMPFGNKNSLIFKSVNLYDLETKSNILVLD